MRQNECLLFASDNLPVLENKGRRRAQLMEMEVKNLLRGLPSHSIRYYSGKTIVYRFHALRSQRIVALEDVVKVGCPELLEVLAQHFCCWIACAYLGNMSLDSGARNSRKFRRNMST